MPVNEEPPEPEPDPRVVRVQNALIRSRDLMGGSDRMPIRVILLVIIVGICMTLAPTPANIIGVGALLLLSLDIATHRR